MGIGSALGEERVMEEGGVERPSFLERWPQLSRRSLPGW